MERDWAESGRRAGVRPRSRQRGVAAVGPRVCLVDRQTAEAVAARERPARLVGDTDAGTLAQPARPGAGAGPAATRLLRHAGLPGIWNDEPGRRRLRKLAWSLQDREFSWQAHVRSTGFESPLRRT